MLGLVAGPVELGKQANPMLMRYQTRQAENEVNVAQPITISDVKGMPQAAAEVAIGTGKGLGRVLTASMKSPMLIMNGVTRGFHNLPKAYGEEVREYENITGVRSGLRVSAKVCQKSIVALLIVTDAYQSFGYGLGDGLRDLVTKPIDGAAQNGIIGFGTGLAKGIGNAMFKPTAG